MRRRCQPVPAVVVVVLTTWIPLAVVGRAQPPGEILILGGEIVTAEGRRAADVRVVGETIAEIGAGLVPRDANTTRIDPQGLLVLPGGIDPHVHLGGELADDYTSGSAAALAGGITTLSSFEGVAPGETPAAAVDREAALVRAQSIADVIVHPVIVDPGVATADALSAQAERGQTSIKVFMSQPQFDQFSGSGYSTYAGMEVTGWPKLTLRRGEIVYRDGAQLGAAGSGELLRRARWQAPAF